MIRSAKRRGVQFAALGLFVPAVIGLSPAAHAAGPAAKHSPTIVTTPGTQAIGGATQESATLTGVFFPNPPPADYAYGTLTFTLYGPFTNSAPTTGCNANHLAPLSVADNTANDNPTVITVNVPVTDGKYLSPAVTPELAGYYVWNVKYSGDADNNPATNVPVGVSCSLDVVSMTKASPTLTTPSPAPINPT